MSQPCVPALVLVHLLHTQQEQQVISWSMIDVALEHVVLLASSHTQAFSAACQQTSLRAGLHLALSLKAAHQAAYSSLHQSACTDDQDATPGE